jgi:hypothetical protein
MRRFSWKWINWCFTRHYFFDTNIEENITLSSAIVRFCKTRTFVTAASDVNAGQVTRTTEKWNSCPAFVNTFNHLHEFVQLRLGSIESGYIYQQCTLAQNRKTAMPCTYTYVRVDIEITAHLNVNIPQGLGARSRD